MATFYQKIKLLKGLFASDVAQNGPFYVLVDVTRRCSLQCPGCRFHSSTSNMPAPDDQGEMDIPLDLFRKLCDELRTTGTNSITLTGEGEPCLHPCLYDLILAAKDAGLHVTLATNGTLLNETRIQSFIDSRLDILRMSLWAGSLEEYKKNYPGTNPVFFRKIIKGLKLLTHLKAEQKSTLPSVVLHHPINRKNFKKIDEMVRLANKTGCNALTFSPLKCWRGESTSTALSQDEEKFLYHSLIQMRKRLNSISMSHNISETILRYKMGYAVWEKLPCYIAWYHTRIKLDGTVIPCSRCNLPMGNLNESRLSEVWNGEDYCKYRRKVLMRKGLASLGEHCDCNFCGFVEDNLRVDRIFRWVSPFVRQFKN